MHFESMHDNNVLYRDQITMQVFVFVTIFLSADFWAFDISCAAKHQPGHQITM